jgi:ankyrin repeat protein
MNKNSGEQKTSALKEFLDHTSKYNVEFPGVTVDSLNVQSLSGDCLLHVAVRFWDDWGSDVLQSLIDNGVKIDTVGDLGFTPLHVAAMKGNLEAVQILVQNGARLEVADEDGSTALDNAVLHGHGCVANHLRESLR